MKKVIVLDHEPWTLQRKRMIYDLFASAGIRIEVLDLSQWLYEGYSIPDELKDEDYLRRIHSREEFDRLLDEEDPENTIIVNQVYRVWQNRAVYHDVAKRNFKTIFIDFYANSRLRDSGAKDSHNIINRIRDAYLNIVTTKHPTLAERLGMKLYFRHHGIKAFDHGFSSNSLTKGMHGFNHPDYEKFRFQQHRNIVEGRYIVFCDTYFPLHSDLKVLLKEKKAPSAEVYQNLMKRLFDATEEKYGVPVVIAAHPKSDYRGDEFGNRKIIKYNTDNLVYYADKVIIHICNSISYSILCDKPIAFVTTDDYLDFGSQANIVRQWERGLGLKSQNLNSIAPEEVKFMKVDPAVREQYIYSYLTSKETENTPNAETIKSFLESEC